MSASTARLILRCVMCVWEHSSCAPYVCAPIIKICATNFTFNHLIDILARNSFLALHYFPKLVLFNNSCIVWVKRSVLKEWSVSVTAFFLSTYLNTCIRLSSLGSCLLCKDTRVRYSLNERECHVLSQDTRLVTHRVSSSLPVRPRHFKTLCASLKLKIPSLS